MTLRANTSICAVPACASCRARCSSATYAADHGPSGGSPPQRRAHLRAHRTRQRRGSLRRTFVDATGASVPLPPAVRHLVATDDEVAALLLGLGAVIVGCAGNTERDQARRPAARPGSDGGRRTAPGCDRRRRDRQGARSRGRTSGPAARAGRTGHRGGARSARGGRGGHAGPARRYPRHPAAAATPGAGAALAAAGARADRPATGGASPLTRALTRAFRTARVGRRRGVCAAAAGTGRGGEEGSSPAPQAWAGSPPKVTRQHPECGGRRPRQFQRPDTRRAPPRTAVAAHRPRPTGRRPRRARIAITWQFSSQVARASGVRPVVRPPRAEPRRRPATRSSNAARGGAERGQQPGGRLAGRCRARRAGCPTGRRAARRSRGTARGARRAASPAARRSSAATPRHRR